MISIVFKSIAGKNPHTDIPGLQMVGHYDLYAFGRIQNLSDLEFEKFQAAVVDPPELIEFARFLYANDEHELLGSTKANGEVERHRLTNEELAGAVNLFKLVLRRKVDNKFSDRFKATAMNVAPHESQTWEIQKKEAELFKENPAAPLRFLPALAESRSVSLEELADKILEKTDRYNKEITQLLGSQQQLRDKIKAPATLRELRVLEKEIDAT